MRIDPIIRNLQDGALGVQKSKDAGTGNSGSFIEELKSKIGDVNQMQTQADQAMSESSVNGASNIHETMIRLEEADMGMRFLAKVRNKALDAYHEIMRMQF
jgi:flagellar hook-basal body complex protein FliE